MKKESSQNIVNVYYSWNRPFYQLMGYDIQARYINALFSIMEKV
jgi:hypothetical protein